MQLFNLNHKIRGVVPHYYRKQGIFTQTNLSTPHSSSHYTNDKSSSCVQNTKSAKHFSYERYIHKIKNNNELFNDYYPILLLGCKKDLTENRKVTFEEAKKFAIFNKLLYAEISIDDDTNRIKPYCQFLH